LVYFAALRVQQKPKGKEAAICSAVSRSDDYSERLAILMTEKRNEGRGSGWLIERRDRQAIEWLVCDSGGFEWTADPIKPIRFCRREDADQVASLFDDIDVHITEHQWGL
jgi:hypothetical protein